jgi:hypothetical protein
MKRLLPFLTAILFLSLSCKKAKEAIYEDLVIKAMTDGQWAITSFTLNGTNITSDFSGYKFQYYSNKTVDAIKNGSVEKTGTWDGNATNKTTSANFPSAINPLQMINGIWNIIDNGWTYVTASQTVGTDVKTMRLDKL